MSFYPKKISERFYAPQNVGQCDNPNAFGTSATFVCGMFLRFSLQIDSRTKEILEARFKTNGCGYLIASADVLAEEIIGEHLNAIHSLDGSILRTKIEEILGVFPESRRHCLDLTLKALQNAFADFRARQIEEFVGEKALICTCFGVSEETIEILIRQKSLETVKEIIDLCRAGGGCGSCQPLIQELIDIARSEDF